jgi:RNA polymerase subunit RPABC4/transcription elongation factor Spt4
LVQSRDGFDTRDNSIVARSGGNGGSRDSRAGGDEHLCPWCGSADTVHVQRGFVGPTDDRNQYLTCNDCDRVTFEIISRTVRDMRVGQFRVGGSYRDASRNTKYTITRVLKVGMNECLLYVKPVIRAEAESNRSRDRD